MLTGVKVLFFCCVFLATLQFGESLKCYSCYGVAECAETPGKQHEEDCYEGELYGCTRSFRLEDSDTAKAGELYSRGCQNLIELGVHNETWCSAFGGWAEYCYCYTDFCNGEMVPCSLRETNKDVPGSCKQ